MISMFNIYNNDPMGMVIFTYPLLVLVISLVMQLIFKKMFAILLINFVFWLIAAFTIFNSSFLIWCFVYTFISFLGTVIGDLIIIFKNEFTRKRKNL
ncbi:MAG: hypothetical protein ACI8WT_004312 [Clostridium sp.]|jgi:hypothetical protein